MPADNRPSDAQLTGEHAVLSWDDLIDLCSRLHTKRTRPMGPWPDAPLREDSQMIDVLIYGLEGQVVPTRMHEPGFYWRWSVGPEAGDPQRSEEAIDRFRTMVERGEVRRA